MSRITWRRDEIIANLHKYRGLVYRCVDALDQMATQSVTDSADEQDLVENAIERSKPTIPAAAHGRHFLLSTPFRHTRQRRLKASRFKAPGADCGVFDASEKEEAALAETAFYILLSLAESISASPPFWTGQKSIFSVNLDTDRALDLTQPPFRQDRAVWRDPFDYGPCQEMGAKTREAGGALIRYESARDPDETENVAVFDPTAFADAAPQHHPTWHLVAGDQGVLAKQEFTGKRLSFPRHHFDRDERLAPLWRWSSA